MGVVAGSLAAHFGDYLVLKTLPGVRLQPLGHLHFNFSLHLLGVAMVRAFWQLTTPHSEP
jgi:hypothetical protein